MCDRVGLRDQGQVARLHLERLGAHALGHEAFEIGIDRPVFRRNSIETRLRAPGRVRGLAREQSLVERLLDRIEDLRLCFRQVAREIVQERSLAETSFIAVEDNPGGRRWRRKCLGQRCVILARIRCPRRHIDKSRHFGCMPASVTIIPEKECPTRTVGPSCRASTRSAEATASGSVVRGFCTAVTLRPVACKRAITSDQDDPSANNPCTRTTYSAYGASDAAAFAPRMRVLAAPAATMLTNLRRFIGYLICGVAICTA